MAVLPTPGSPIRRIVLGTAAEHLDDALDLGVAPDHRIEASSRASAVRSRVYF